MKRQHKRPCRECPWKVQSARGWLGGSTPLEFLQTSEAEQRMPCHMHVDYERADWEAQAAQAPQCAGRAIHFANRCKLPRDPALLRLPADRDGVITQAQDFIDHHTLGDEPAPRIMIMHQLVTVLKDAEVEQE